MYRHILETDQIQCYAQDGQSVPCQSSGQDASFEKIHLLSRRQRFRLLSHVVADELTGAVWSRDANPTEYPLTWNEAMAFVADMRARQAHGYDNWRLPSRDLLFSLISHQHVNPALPGAHPFDNVFPGYYWTADSCCRLPDQAWYVHLGGGRVHRGMKHGSYMVWPISPGNPKSVDPGTNGRVRFTVADDASVHDAHTGLIWSGDADLTGRLLTWQEALAMVQTLNRKQFGGCPTSGNWRAWSISARTRRPCRPAIRLSACRMPTGHRRPACMNRATPGHCTAVTALSASGSSQAMIFSCGR
jgi:hypothetical protein